MAMAYYKIGEAAALLNLKSYVLRFWETEFPAIVPLRTEKGQRLYAREHLALLQRIRYLLHDRGLTIDGARKVLAEEKQRGVVYVFQEPGASVCAAAEEGGAAAPLDLSFPLAGHGDGPETGEDEGPDSEETPAGYGGAPCAKAVDSGSKQLVQYNLPGFDDLIAMRASVLDSEGGDAYSPDEGSAFPASSGEQGMLPLFTLAHAACSADKASGRGGKAEGGGNFIHAGAPVTPYRAATGEKRPCDGISDDFLRALARDLESVAALLRPGASFEK